MTEQKQIPEAYWVMPGRLLAGRYPAGSDEFETRARLRWLLAQGVDFWLDLTEESEYELPGYTGWLFNEAEMINRQVAYRRLPIEDYSTPSVEFMTRILDTLDEALQAGHVVYLHCYGGKGRTGTVVGCYLVRQGMEGGAALERLETLCEGSPETDDQRRYVLNWNEN